MKTLRLLLCCATLALVTSTLHAQKGDGYAVGDRLPQSKTASAKQGYKEIGWEALVPKDWDPSRLMEEINLDDLNDNDPRAEALLEKMRKIWDEAPVDASLNGARIRIPGFLVPLDAQRGQVREFLLVPYFGACLHTPPPPANQIIHAVAAKPLKDAGMMAAVWVSGTLETVRSDTEFGASAYRLKAEVLKPYQ